MKKTNKIFALAMTFVMGLAVATPLLAQEVIEIDTDTIRVPSNITHKFERILYENMEKKLEQFQQKLIMDRVPSFEISEKSMTMITLFASTIDKNDAISFDGLYNLILNDNSSTLGEDYLRVLLFPSFGLFDYTGSEEEKTELLEAILSNTWEGVDTFMQLYSEIEDSEKQEVLENTFSKLKLNKVGRKLIQTRIDKSPKKI